MPSVALVGADGSGKTTIAALLRERLSIPTKYIYMGTATQSSNITLPTTRLILYLKQRAHRESSAETDATAFVEHQPVRRGRLGAALSLLNRLAEEWYRQLVAWSYQLRGNLVLFDRHFLFEHAAHARELRKQQLRLSDRVHLWTLYKLYPRPDLVVFLDAPTEVLLQRKQEWAAQRLEQHRREVLELGALMPAFVRVDATQPLDDVVSEVIAAIERARGDAHAT